LNEIKPYIEISKPKLRNNLKQLFAMKKIILILLTAVLSLSNTPVNGQVATQEFYPTVSGVDSIVVYKIRWEVPHQNFRPLAVLSFFIMAGYAPAEIAEETGKLYECAYDAKYDGERFTHGFLDYGAYAILSYKDGELLPVTYALIDKKWSKHKRRAHGLKYKLKNDKRNVALRA